MGGFAKVQEAIEKVAKEHGVDFRTSDAVKEIEVTNNKVMLFIRLVASLI